MRRLATTVALTSLLLASACGGSDDKADTPSGGGSTGASKAGATVPMVLTEFKPTDFTIKAGETLTFENENNITHVIVGGSWKADANGLRTEEKDDKSYDLKVSKKGDKVEHTFDKPGTYQFFCTIHKGMNGTVTVS